MTGRERTLGIFLLGKYFARYEELDNQRQDKHQSSSLCLEPCEIMW